MTKQQRFFQRTACAVLMLIGWSYAADATGDRVVVKLGDPKRPATLRAHLLNGAITVKGYEGNEVIVEAHQRGRENADDSDIPKGMRRIPQASSGLSVDSENNDVNVKVEDLRWSVDLTITVPHRTSVSLHNVNGGNITVSDIEGELDVNSLNGTVILNRVSGNVVAHALNGRILATLNRVDPSKPMAFSSLNGDIDVTFPPDIKANLTLRTDNGEIYSDFDIQPQANAPQQAVEDDGDSEHSHIHRHRVRIDKTIHATLNGGGPEIQIKGFNGNIYIRKAGK